MSVRDVSLTTYVHEYIYIALSRGEIKDPHIINIHELKLKKKINKNYIIFKKRKKINTCINIYIYIVLNYII